MLGCCNLGFDYFQILDYIKIFEYIHEYFLQIIFLFIFVIRGVKNNIYNCIHRICLLPEIFVENLFATFCPNDSDCIPNTQK